MMPIDLYADFRKRKQPMPSCTFMDIANRFGVDYGDVLLVTELYRRAPAVSNPLVREAYHRLRETNGVALDEALTAAKARFFP